MRGKFLNATQLDDARQILLDIDSLDGHTSFLFDKINFLMDATVGFININQNKIVKLFSVASVALLPPTLIASIYGMNFKSIPELDWKYGYVYSVSLMVVSIAIPFWIFHKKGLVEVNGYELWDQLLGDIHGYMVVWEVVVLVVGLVLAWIFNKLILATVFTNAPESWKVGMGGVARIIFPLLALITVHIGQFALDRWQYHTSLLQLASILLLAMAVIRLTVYALRYVFPAGGWVRTTETLIVWVIWAMVALHLAGLLTILSAFLEGLSFTLGKHEFSVLLLIQSLLIVVVTLVVTLWAGRIMENR